MARASWLGAVAEALLGRGGCMADSTRSARVALVASPPSAATAATMATTLSPSASGRLWETEALPSAIRMALLRGTAAVEGRKGFIRSHEIS
jgi:hypothetical protein